MNKRIITGIILYFILGIFIIVKSAQSQDVKIAKYQYISPVPGSKYIMPQSNIAIRHGELIQIESLQNLSIQVEGSISGRVSGKTILSDDLKTVIFKPYVPFNFGEKVHVIVYEGLKTISGFEFEQTEFNFTIASSIPKLPANYFLENEFNPIASQKRKNQKIESSNSFEYKNNNLPDDFPEITINTSENLPPEGYYFLAAFSSWGWFPDATPYLIILDEYGTPVFYRKNYGHCYDFKKLVNGNLVYYANSSTIYKWVIEDEMFNVVDYYSIEGGYSWTDWHEFLMLPNGHAFVMAYDPQLVDMSQIVPGGYSEAIVSGWIVQELDLDHNVVFQWRSWDHYLLTDAHEYVDLTDSIIDPIHGNAIEVYSDDALLLSPRNLNEITKIDWNSGSIIWRLGGENNMFQFVNDTLGFSMQHDCRRLENGNITLFDNGTFHPETISSVIEYDLDEENFTATLIKRYRNNPDAFGTIMGNGQETEAGNMVAGWGSSGYPAITEFNTNGDVLAEINIESLSYRAYRFPWESSCFSLDEDSLHFGYIYFENEVVKNVNIQNNMDYDIEISSFYSTEDAFSITTELPIVIEAGGSKSIQLKFAPIAAGNFKGILTVNSDINTEQVVQRVAQQVHVAGDASENQSIADNQILVANMYPNPTNKDLIIEFPQSKFNGTVQLYDIFGKNVINQIFSEANSVELNLRHLPSGVYFVYLTEQHNAGSQYYKIIKN